jgi:tripeptidyl-peptidase-1
LQNFLQQFRPDLAALNPAYDFIDQSIDGGVDDQSKPAGGEENLDIQVLLPAMASKFSNRCRVQWTMGLANGIPVYYAALGDQVSDSGSNWIDLANTLHGLDDSSLPKVMTTSYGFGETGLGDQFLQYVRHCCRAYR